MKGKKMSVSERKAKIKSDKVERRKVFKELLQHIEGGYSLDCFATLSDTSISTYLKEYPEEFVMEELEDSIRKAKSMWENIGHRQANGQCLGNSRSWYYNMVNRYGWHEKSEVKSETKGEVNVNIVSYASKKPS